MVLLPFCIFINYLSLCLKLQFSEDFVTPLLLEIKCKISLTRI